MKIRSFPVLRATALCALLAIVGAGSATFDAYGQAPAPDKEKKSPQPSDAEKQAVQKIVTLTDPAAKWQATTEFIKKYPKSALRPSLAQSTAVEIARIQDPAQQITYAENYLTVFNQPEESDLVFPLLVDAYTKAKRLDDAFRVAGSFIQKHPGDIGALTQMAIVGIEEAKRNNTKYVQQSQQYGLKAIELIEADKRPEGIDDARWNEYKTFWLPQLYQSLGIVSMMTGNRDDARIRLEKSASLNAYDPITFMVLGGMVQEEYQQIAQQAKGMLPGAAQSEAIKKAEEKMDQVIQFYAQAVGLASGNPQYQMLHDELLKDLKTYYAYRHKGSTDGLQQLIDKYKRPAEIK